MEKTCFGCGKSYVRLNQHKGYCKEYINFIKRREREEVYEKASKKAKKEKDMELLKKELELHRELLRDRDEEIKRLRKENEELSRDFRNHLKGVNNKLIDGQLKIINKILGNSEIYVYEKLMDIADEGKLEQMSVADFQRNICECVNEAAKGSNIDLNKSVVKKKIIAKIVETVDKYLAHHPKSKGKIDELKNSLDDLD